MYIFLNKYYFIEFNERSSETGKTYLLKPSPWITQKNILPRKSVDQLKQEAYLSQNAIADEVLIMQNKF